MCFFFLDLKTPKSPFEINWPLATMKGGQIHWWGFHFGVLYQVAILPGSTHIADGATILWRAIVWSWWVATMSLSNLLAAQQDQRVTPGLPKPSGHWIDTLVLPKWVWKRWWSEKKIDYLNDLNKHFFNLWLTTFFYCLFICL